MLARYGEISSNVIEGEDGRSVVLSIHGMTMLLTIEEMDALFEVLRTSQKRLFDPTPLPLAEPNVLPLRVTPPRKSYTPTLDSIL